MRKGRMRRKVWLWILVCLVFAASLDYWLYPSFVQPSGKVVNRRENGLWLRYAWYFGERSRDETSGLASRLRRHGIRDAFFHVRNIDRHGRLVYRRLKQTQELNEGLRKADPGIRRIAWIYAGNRQGLGLVELSSPKVRRNMCDEASWLVRQCGFDGVQWDYEICPDGDQNLLKLLEETRKALPGGAYLGVAVPTWYPAPFAGFGWSTKYYGQVSSRCDCLAVMAYDSGLYTPRAYVSWVSQQVIRITQAVAASNPKCSVLMGIPTYREGTASHNPRAENLRLALIGVRDGLAGAAALSAWQGVSPFADYTMTDEDWREFDRLWPYRAPRISAKPEGASRLVKGTA